MKLSYSIPISLVMLILVITVSVKWPKLLDIDPVWLAICTIPIIIALITGGYLKSLKAFGVEVETSLKKPIADIGFTLEDALEIVPAETKGGTDHLPNLTDEEKLKKKRLKFTLGGNYDGSAIQKYLNAYKNLNYFEIADDNDCFICLVPTSLFQPPIETSINDINTNYPANMFLISFTDAVRDQTILRRFREAIITTAFLEDSNMIDVFNKMVKLGADVAAIVSDDRKLIGIVKLKNIEAKILGTLVTNIISK